MAVFTAVRIQAVPDKRQGRLFPVVLAALVATTGWLAAGVATASAAPITPGSGWNVFTWSGGGQPFNLQGAFTFTSTAPAVVTVTDVLCRGDQFRVYDNAAPMGDTSVPAPPTCSGNIGNPNVAVHDPSYSHGSFLVPAGSHAITLQAIVNPFAQGGGYLRVDTCTVFGPGDLVGTTGDDVICGSPGPDRISALGGNDLIFAFGGADQISAGDGNDTVFAGTGADRIAGGGGDDVLDGQEDNDLITGETGTDTAYGGSGTDTCIAENRLFCEA